MHRVWASSAWRVRPSCSSTLVSALLELQERLTGGQESSDVSGQVGRPGGTRRVPLREFHEGPYETVVQYGEILTEIRYPIRPGAGSAYEKVERRAGDWGVATSGVYVVVSGGVVTECGIGLAAVGAEHYCSPEGEAALVGKEPTEENLAAAAAATAASCSPNSDQRGPADYKAHLAHELTLRALRRAARASQGA